MSAINPRRVYDSSDSYSDEEEAGASGRGNRGKGRRQRACLVGVSQGQEQTTGAHRRGDRSEGGLGQRKPRGRRHPEVELVAMRAVDTRGYRTALETEARSMYDRYLQVRNVDLEAQREKRRRRQRKNTLWWTLNFFLALLFLSFASMLIAGSLVEAPRRRGNLTIVDNRNKSDNATTILPEENETATPTSEESETTASTPQKEREATKKNGKSRYGLGSEEIKKIEGAITEVGNLRKGNQSDPDILEKMQELDRIGNLTAAEICSAAEAGSAPMYFVVKAEELKKIYDQEKSSTQSPFEGSKSSLEPVIRAIAQIVPDLNGTCMGSTEWPKMTIAGKFLALERSRKCEGKNSTDITVVDIARKTGETLLCVAANKGSFATNCTAPVTKEQCSQKPTPSSIRKETGTFETTTQSQGTLKNETEQEESSTTTDSANTGEE